MKATRTFADMAKGFLRRVATRLAIPISVTGVLFLMWEGVVRVFDLPRYLLPSPLDVWRVLLDDAALLGRQGFVTAQEWAMGLSLSIVAAFLLCSACYASHFVRQAIRPLLVVSQAIPYLTFAPLLLLWLGLGMTPKVVLVVLTCTFPIAAVWLDALIDARKEYEAVCAMLKMSRIRAFFAVSMPASLQGFFSGLKVSVSYAVVSATMSELIGSEAGLGVYIIRAQSTYRTDRVMAAVFVVVVASLLSTWLVERVRKRVVFWPARAR